ncbi:glycosyltransferase family 2 protein [Microvirga sp. W0021]|uniref:Glycosyltransferase family 2 protein n=1 Tax=Hohaiivirga grylli TaxID=3133970 RepID=A0ABV0BJ74_9HYPH
MPSKGAEKICVCLCTYNGEHYLDAQLQSLVQQTDQNFSVLVSDDASTDGTLKVLEAYHSQQKLPLSVRQGPRSGVTANFLSFFSEKNEQATFFAFCDQDDIWKADKLERARRWLSSVPENVPALYGSRVRLIDAEGHPFGTTVQPSKPLVFANALIQNFTSGNTMVFNRAAYELVQKSLQTQPAGLIPIHDWWVYLIVSGAGGEVYCDDYESLDYRQHASNLIGAKTGFFALRGQLDRLLGGQTQAWLGRNLQALENSIDLLSEDNRALFLSFKQARSSSFFSRLRYSLQMKVYRQGRVGQVGMLIAFILGKL